MNLEQRVDVVEQELNLIKAQIQEILLQIQEQLLKDAHPVLRAEEPRKAAARAPEAVAVPTSSAAPVKRTNGTASEPTLVEVPTNGNRPSTPSRAYPQAKQVRADTFTEQRPSEQRPSEQRQSEQRQSEQPLTGQPPTERPTARQPNDRRASAPSAPPFVPSEQPPARSNGHRAASPAYQPAEVKVWIQLDQWVSQKVRELGIKRTRELINLCEEPERSLLLQFIDVYDEQSVQSRPAQQQYPTQPYQDQPYSNPQYHTDEPIYTRPVNTAPIPARAPMQTPAEQWQQHANATTRGGEYSPFGEHQDLVLGLIKALLENAQRAPAVMTNGNGHANY